MSLQILKSIHNIYKSSDGSTLMAVSGKRTVHDSWFCFEHSNTADEIMAIIPIGMQANLIRKLMLCRWTFLPFHMKENQWWDVEFILLFLCKWWVFTNTKIIQVTDHTFYRFTGVITHTGCWNNTKTVCESRATGDCMIYQLSSIFPTSKVGYYAG